MADQFRKCLASNGSKKLVIHIRNYECKEECVTDISMSVHLSSVADHFYLWSEMLGKFSKIFVPAKLLFKARDLQRFVVQLLMH